MIPTTNSKFDPNVIYPWQTWERFAKGRTLVGVNESDTDFKTAGLNIGEKTHTLTASEMPTHTHLAAVHGGSSSYGRSRTKIGSFQVGTTGYADSSTIIENGGDEPHNNIQPSTTVYYWRRTA